ncbi:MAG: TonB-dependent receptor, partial [Gemmatimonadales bacterium]
MHRETLVACLAVAGLMGAPQLAQAQRATVVGVVTTGTARAPVPGVLIAVEGTALTATSDTLGRFRLVGVPPGPQVLLARRIGFAPTRVPLTVPPTGEVQRDIEMAEHALQLADIRVTADVSGRARGESGTSTVVEREAIAHQTASSVAGVLELLPGVPLQPPGLDGIQQFALRSVPTGTSASLTVGGPSAGAIGALGTLIVLDGVPLSNNANLQTAGPRGESSLPATAGGGIDLRQIPATTIERLEAIRGVPSARYGDLTQGVIVVDTRAGEVTPQTTARMDVRTLEVAAIGGWRLGSSQTATGHLTVARTNSSPGFADNQATRVTTQLSHRLARPAGSGTPSGASLDSRLSFFQLFQDNPEQTNRPGVSSSNRDRGLRVLERLRIPLGTRTALTFSGAMDYTQRRTVSEAPRVRGASPFTSRIEEGRQEGRFVQGQYQSAVRLDGDEWRLYHRGELDAAPTWLGMPHQLRVGLELTREWNAGPGYVFDIEFPPQVQFNGVQGYDRPRRFDAVPPLAATAAYLDDRIVGRLIGPITAEVQAGMRLDLLHSGRWWFSGVRDAVLQPRLNLQVAPGSWLRLRAGWGRTAKLPTLGQLYPALQYYDVVNVNWFADDPAERLAVLTTFIRDPSNPDLAFSLGHKREAGFELTPARGFTMALVAFEDRTTGAIGFRPDHGFLTRDHYALSDSTLGTGVPPTFVEPPAFTDTVPILIERPANILTLENQGFEVTLQLPRIVPLGLSIEAQGAWMTTEFRSDAVDFGRTFNDFQFGTAPRAPYWDGIVRKGERALVTYRLVHHQPRFGLVVSLTLQHVMNEVLENVAATDTLAFAGYITRTGTLVPVPVERRGDPEFADIRVARAGVTAQATETPADVLTSLQVSKTLPFGGEFRFYAFNAIDRLGRAPEVVPARTRSWPPLRFGFELTAPLRI